LPCQDFSRGKIDATAELEECFRICHVLESCLQATAKHDGNEGIRKATAAKTKLGTAKPGNLGHSAIRGWIYDARTFDGARPMPNREL